MMKFLRSFLLFAFSMCIWSAGVFAQGTISGTVKDRSGNAIAFGTVRLLGSGLGATTDNNGSYRIANVPAGTYSAVASYVGYGQSTQVVTVADGQNTQLDFALAEDQLDLGEVIVTGVVNPRSAISSSVSISTLKPDAVQQASPRSTAEILRSIPGVRSEASAGDGNTNITVRGVPIATGGSKYLQLHEDGLPVLQFGDIAFGTADIFLRADYTVDRIEALRGGSASTLASNSPAGVINFISKTGEVEGGNVGTTIGLDFPNFRTDFDYGSPIGNNVSFHVGGFFRQGDGPRRTGYTSSYGGQLKASLTKRWNQGYSRMYFKYLNDRTPAYLPMPMRVTGTNDDPTWESVDGYDAKLGTLHSPYMLNNIGTGPDGTPRRSTQADGMHPVSTAIGNETAFDIGEGWRITNRARMAFNKGRFVSPFPAQVGTADALAQEITGSSSYTLQYTDGTAFPANANGNGLLTRIHLFDTELNNFNNFTDDLNVTKSFEKIDVTVGVYKAFQRISMSWLWNSFLTDVNDEHVRPVNLSSNGTNYTQNGLLAYGVPFWGNCCHRNYDTQYDITAPYAAAELKLTSALTVDGSFRYDIGNVQGSYAGGDGQTSAIDVDGDGTINFVEQEVATINNANAKPVNYDYDYASFSIGANYLFNPDMALFGRYSSGGRANADRLLFGPYILPDGSAAADLSSDMVTQAEVGFKYRRPTWALNATAFLANVEEQNFEATTQNSVNREYQALGLELDGALRLNRFDLRGGLTFTDAEIKKDALTPELEGNTPRRQADLIFNLAPAYRFGRHAVGLSFIGTTKSFAQDNNELIMPGYTYVNGFADFNIIDNLFLSLNVNNLFNTIGVTESEEGSIVPNQENVVRARSITGRSTTASLRYTF
ncbi:MAG: TonB-dependent receptor [Saprospiraceae bacterium]|nr:TonB-dependent receptor [Saprospiraceae bacterium]